MTEQFLELTGAFIFYYPIIMSIVWMIGATFFYWRRERNLPELPELHRFPLVSVLIPARNEGLDIRDTILSVVNSAYPNVEIVVVNDASTDNTLEILRQLQQEYANVRILNLEKNMGKANGLNLAFSMSKGEVIATIDADCLLDRCAIHWAVWHFEHFPRVGALTGNPRVRNRTSLLAKVQTAEYSSVIGLIKRTQRLVGKIMTVSGVIAFWRRTAILNAGLWSNDMITDDIDMTWKIEKRFWDVRYEPNVICWMLVPESVKGLWRQRKRWAQGGAEVLKKHRDVFRSWKYRRLWPIYVDYFLGITWSYALVIAFFFWCMNLILGTEFSFGTLGNPFLYWNGSVVATVCLMQFFVSLSLDRKYDRGLWKIYFWVVWYPVVYWLYSALAAVVATPKALFGKRKTAVWVSPDRGIRGEAAEDAKGSGGL